MPIANGALPLASASIVLRRCFAGSDPDSHAMSTPTPASQLESLRQCCSARISVGAMNATCRPLSIACSAASAATIVLPEPTSPCRRRCIGMARFRSWLISRHTRSCARVSVNGTRSRSVRVSVPVPVRTGARRLDRALRCAFSDSCCASSSSNLSRVHAGCVRASSAFCVSADSRGGGACRKRTASANFQRRRLRTSSSGSVSVGARGVREQRTRSELAQRVLRKTRGRRINRASADPATAYRVVTTLNCGCTISGPK